jgi:alpha-L-arabinofuranosidase
MTKKRCCIAIAFIITSAFNLHVLHAQAQKLTVLVNKLTAEVQPTMWGIFFEDINFAADGGIYAELVKNRSFEFSNPLMGWKEVKQNSGDGKILVLNQGESAPNNPRFVRISSYTGSGSFGIVNEGFRGMGVSKDKSYNFSVLARKNEGNIKLRIELVNSSNEKIGEASVPNLTDKWEKYTVSFTCSGTDAKARLNVLLDGRGSLDLDMISLFPQDTWKNRPNGLRADLVQLLYDLKPGFIRFPGGCIVEGRDLSNRYQWKTTVGKPEDRKLIINRWNTEFRNRLTPDYFQSFGLGFFEYFQLAEDIGAEPLPIINCGMACQYNTGEVVAMDQLEPFVQDALDLIEFANGSTDSKMGKLRAEMGHPAPFNLKMLGVGNEQWDEQYIERYKVFSAAIKTKYPDIKFITSAGPSPDGKQFEYLWSELRKLNADLVDEHYYRKPDWFLQGATRYDNYDRKGPKVFAGEYASHSDKQENIAESRNNWESALSEAAFMTGLERNADVVQMASYAPLFAHVDAWQWRPDMIWFDNLRAVATPNYYVQKVFANNRGTHVVPVLKDNSVVTGKDSLYASATIDKKTKEVFIKIVNVSSKSKTFEIAVEGASLDKKPIVCQAITASDIYDFNGLEHPKTVYPVDKTIRNSGNKIPVTLDKSSVTLLKASFK